MRRSWWPSPQSSPTNHFTSTRLKIDFKLHQRKTHLRCKAWLVKELLGRINSSLRICILMYYGQGLEERGAKA